MSGSAEIVSGEETSPGQIEAMLIDLDGTLIDTVPDLATATNEMLVALGRAEKPVADVRRWVGNGASRLVKRALTGSFDGEPESALFDRAYPLFLESYATNVCVESKPYPGVFETLSNLVSRDLRLACVTNKPEAFTLPLLERLDLSRFFEIVVSGDTLPKKKPDPEPMWHACEALRSRPQQCLAVGASANVVRAAEAAGIPMICVTYGYNQGVDLNSLNAEAMIDQFDGILAYLDR